ncbi:MAG: hypothetical protein HYY84_12765 [Deltaproteobacteria bacterium]|nr:hypothetical protein [Deltaproteobacteria bacterium]
MTHRLAERLPAVLLVIAISACKSEGVSNWTGEIKKTTVGGPVAIRSVFFTLPSLGLEIDMPADSKAEVILGDTVAIHSEAAFRCGVRVWAEKREFDPDYAHLVALGKVGRPSGGPAESLSHEKNPSGEWRVEWVETLPSTGRKLFPGTYRRIIDGKPYRCVRSASTTPEAADCAARACMSLRKPSAPPTR